MSGGGWKRVITNNNRFPADHPDYRRACLLNMILLVLSGVCLFFAIMDVLVFKLNTAAAVNAAGVVSALATLIYFHKTDDIKNGTMVTVLIMLATLSGFLWSMEHRHYALYWICVFPPVVYFLLGRRKARFVTISFCACLLFFILSRYNNWEPDPFRTESIFNIVIATFVLILAISYFELSRKEVAAALEKQNRELEKLSVTDSLTGLYNRTKLDSAITDEIARVSRTGKEFSLILSDLDFFKNVNDRFGHIVGDGVLIDIANILKSSCRHIDVIGRWGGEEFLIVCPETDARGVNILAARLLENVIAYTYHESEKITLSLGVTTYAPGDTMDALLRRADRALYLAKSNGRRRVESA